MSASTAAELLDVAADLDALLGRAREQLADADRLLAAIVTADDPEVEVEVDLARDGLGELEERLEVLLERVRRHAWWLEVAR